MDDAIRDFGMQLGHRVLARDWAGTHALLAPWLFRLFPHNPALSEALSHATVPLSARTAPTGWV